VETIKMPAVETARVYTRLGEEAGLNWMYERLTFIRSGTFWDRMVLADLRQNLLDLQRDVTGHVLAGTTDDPSTSLDAFVSEHAADIEFIRDLQQRAAAASTPSALSVIASRFDRLRPPPDASVS